MKWIVTLQDQNKLMSFDVSRIYEEKPTEKRPSRSRCQQWKGIVLRDLVEMESPGLDNGKPSTN